MGQRGEGLGGTCCWSPESPVKWMAVENRRDLGPGGRPGGGLEHRETLVQEGG